MPKFVFRGDHPVSLYKPEGEPAAFLVEPGQTVEVPGELAGDAPEDAWLVVNGGDPLAWPKALWELVEDKPAKPVKGE